MEQAQIDLFELELEYWNNLEKEKQEKQEKKAEQENLIIIELF